MIFFQSQRLVKLGKCFTPDEYPRLQTQTPLRPYEAPVAILLSQITK